MNISRFFLLLTMVTISVTLSGQNEQEPDTLIKEPAVKPFIRLGFDLCLQRQGLLQNPRSDNLKFRQIQNCSGTGFLTWKEEF